MNAQLQAPAAVSPGKNTLTHLTGGWVGPRGSLDVLKKKESLAPTGIQTPDRPVRSLIVYYYYYYYYYYCCTVLFFNLTTHHQWIN
jgi:hypothetical protein